MVKEIKRTKKVEEQRQRNFRERFRKGFIQKLGRKKGFSPKTNGKELKRLRARIQLEKLKIKSAKLRQQTPRKIQKPQQLQPQPSPLSITLLRGGTPLERFLNSFSNETQLSTLSSLGEAQRQIENVSMSAQSTVDAGLDASKNNEWSAMGTKNQVNREVELINLLIQGKL